MLIIGIVGWSGAGKTTLLEGVIRSLASRGLKVATVKHAHRRFDMDRPGKDSFRHREAGARQVLVASPDRWALLSEHPGEPEIDLAAALDLLDPADVVLVEGYKGAEIDKIEVWRPAHGQPPLWPADGRIVAVATDATTDTLPAPLDGRPLLPLNAPEGVAGYVLDRLARETPDMARPAPAEAQR